MAAYYFARTQFENLGDRGIALILLHEIAKYQAIKIIAINSPKDYCLQLSQTPGSTMIYFPMHALRSLFSDLISGDQIFLVMKPGHIFGNKKQLFKHLAQLLMVATFKVLGAKVVRLGASVGPLSRVIEPIEALSSKLYTNYSVRESLSHSYTKSIGCRNPQYFPDFGFLFEPKYFDYSHNMRTHNKQLKFISVSIREYENLGHKSTAVSAIEELIRIRPEMELRFVVQVQFDIDSLTEISARLHRSADTLIEWFGSDVKLLLSVYEETAFVLSNRLHVLLFAASLGAVPLALVSKTRDTKIVGIFSDNGLKDLLLDLDDPSSIIKRIQNIEHNEQHYRQLVTDTFDVNRRVVQQNCQLLFGQ